MHTSIQIYTFKNSFLIWCKGFYYIFLAIRVSCKFHFTCVLTDPWRPIQCCQLRQLWVCSSFCCCCRPFCIACCNNSFLSRCVSQLALHISVLYTRKDTQRRVYEFVAAVAWLIPPETVFASWILQCLHNILVSFLS